MIGYVDSSAILRPLLEPELNGTLSDLALTALFTSRLSAIDCRRTIDRIRLVGGLNDEQVVLIESKLRAMEGSLTWLTLGDDVLQLAGARSDRVLRTLDAIHVATAQVLREAIGVSDTILFLTHDRQQATAARALGFQIAGVDLSAGPT